MNRTEYIARVINYYSNNYKPKMGKLNFDSEMDRFYIKNLSGQKAKIAPSDGFIHCGDIYIVRDNDKKWKIAQCEKTIDGKWKMLGTSITEDNCCGNRILYITNRRLQRLSDDFIDESFSLEELSDELVDKMMLHKNK